MYIYIFMFIYLVNIYIYIHILLYVMAKRGLDILVYEDYDYYDNVYAYVSL